MKHTLKHIYTFFFIKNLMNIQIIFLEKSTEKLANYNFDIS